MPVTKVVQISAWKCSKMRRERLQRSPDLLAGFTGWGQGQGKGEGENTGGKGIAEGGGKEKEREGRRDGR